MVINLEDVTNGSSLSFKQANKEITPAQAFNKSYEGLEELIDYNRKKHFLKKNGVNIESELYYTEELDHFMNWFNNIPEDITAKLTIDNQEYFFNVKPRTDLEHSKHQDPTKKSMRTRMPSIIYLEEQETGKSMIMRKTNIWDAQTIRADLKDIGSKGNKKWQEAVIDDDEWGKYFDPEKIYLMPEPLLRIALKRVGNEVTSIIGTGKEVYFDEQSKDLYLIRPFLESITDIPLNVDKVVDYVSKIHSFGLTDREDRQIKHYCLQKEINNGINMVNIDPDLYLFVGKYNKILDNDRGDFLKDISYLSPVIQAKEKEIKTAIRNSYSGPKIKKEFIEAIPTSVADMKSSITNQLYK